MITIQGGKSALNIRQNFMTELPKHRMSNLAESKPDIAGERAEGAWPAISWKCEENPMGEFYQIRVGA